MIKGAIEEVTPHRVSGWIYSKQTPLRDALIMAFSDGVCIGTGRVDRFRQDLADAGLGDGYLGYSFSIGLPDGADLASVVVRLDGAEAVLLQRTSRVGRPQTSNQSKELSVDDMLRRIRWLRRRNIIAGAEYDFLRGLARFGVYEVPIDLNPAVPQQSPEDAAAALGKKLLELTVLNEVTLKVARVSEVDNMLQAIRSGADPASGTSHVILWSPVSTRVGVVEGGHLSGSGGSDVAGAVDYHLDPSNILVLHSGCAVVPRPGGVYRSLLVMSGGAGPDVAELIPPRPELARPELGRPEPARPEPARIAEEPRPIPARVPATRR